MSSVKLQINIPTCISLTSSQVLKSVEELLEIKDYKIIDGHLYHFERVSYSDYDYVKVPSESSSYEIIYNKVVLYNDLEKLINV